MKQIDDNMEHWLLWEYVYFITTMLIREGQAKVNLIFRYIGEKYDRSNP